MNQFTHNLRTGDCNPVLLTFDTSDLSAVDQHAVELERQQYQHWLTATSTAGVLPEMSVSDIDATLNLIRSEYVLECYHKYSSGAVSRQRLLGLLHRNLLIRSDMHQLCKERQKKKRAAQKRKRQLADNSPRSVHDLKLLEWDSDCGTPELMQLVTPQQLLELRHDTAYLLQHAVEHRKTVEAVQRLRDLGELEALRLRYRKKLKQ